jgi:lysozyme
MRFAAAPQTGGVAVDRNQILTTFPFAVWLLQAEEGFRPTPYLCTSGALTIGYGHNLTARGIDRTASASWVWTEAQALDQLLDDLMDVVAALDARYPGWRDMDPARQAVVLSSCFQLGVGGASQFKATIRLLQAGDYEGAAAQMLKSRWATQTPTRVQRNADIMRTGVMPEEVNSVRLDQTPDVAATPAEPAARLLPLVAAHVAGSGAVAGPAVATPLRQNLANLTKNPASYGAGGLAAMLVGNVRLQIDLWVFDHLYHFEDVNVVAALVAVGVVLYGLLGVRRG